MLRTRLTNVSNLKINFRLKNAGRVSGYARNQSTDSSAGSSGGVGKLIAKLLGVSTLGIGGVVAYASYDPSFRNLVETNIPYSDTAFQLIVDPLFDKKPSDKKIEDFPKNESLMQKKLARQDQKQKEQVLPSEKKEVEVNTTKVDKEVIPDQNVISNKIKEDFGVAILQDQEKEIKKRNDELEKSIAQLSTSLEDQLKAASLAQRDASKAIKKYTAETYKLLDESEMELLTSDLNSLSEISINKQNALQKSKEEINAANDLIIKLKDRIEDGRLNKVTAANKSLLEGDDAVQKALSAVSNCEKKLIDSEFEDNIAKKYKELLEKSRQNLIPKLKAIVPNFSSEIKLDSIGEDLSKEDNVKLIVLLCKIVDCLNKEVSKQQATEQQKVKEALHAQRKEDDWAFESRISTELSMLKHELNVVHQRNIQQIKEEYDYELRQGLRRQLAAHVEHVQDCLKTQAKDLDKEYNELIEVKVIEEKGRNEMLLKDSFAKLNAIEDFLRSRATVDKAAKKAKELWLACQMLKNTLNVGASQDPNSDLNLKPLTQELNAVKNAAGEANPFVQTLIKTVPEEATARGVYTEEALRARFRKMERVCKRVAMIDETGGSLFKYFVSYIQSFFVLEPALSVEDIEKDEPISLSDLGTFDIISRINICLQQENLIQALRYANLLKGESGNVASDWIKELRLLLETRQVTDALISYAAATSIQAFH